MVTEAQLENAIKRVDKRLDWIEEHLPQLAGPEYVPMGRSEVRPDATSVSADVLELARTGRKIEAIKRYRELTGVDIAQAREAIDNL
jgi:ribosomal protein L7/L12